MECGCGHYRKHTSPLTWECNKVPSKDMMKFDKHFNEMTSAMQRITVSIDKALSDKPQLLPYMRTKILTDITTNIRDLTDSEISNYLETVGITCDPEGKIGLTR